MNAAIASDVSDGREVDEPNSNCDFGDRAVHERKLARFQNLPNVHQ